MSAMAATQATNKALPPVLGRLLSGTFWLALRTPLQAVFSFWSITLMLGAISPTEYGAYGFAWGFGFLQFLLEFGMGSALQRQVSDAYTRGDRQAVDRSLSCGLMFYAVVSAVQSIVLLGIAYIALPYSRFTGPSYDLIVKLLWLQALTSPCYGLGAVATSVLQAARRYDFVPRFELASVVVRFVILAVGLTSGFDFFLVVVTQTLAQMALSLVPACWVVVRELGYVPRFRGARMADFAALTQISFYLFLIQLSVVLADKVDTTILGFATVDPGWANAVYKNVSMPFLQIRQTGWMLAYLVMPAVASLVAARDLAAIERVKYDGTRLLIAMLLPVGLLAWVFAEPFLTLWIGPRFGAEAHLMRLFLVATIPLCLSVLVQMAIGMGQIKVIALSALVGSLVNLPLSYVLTVRLGVAGVIWGTVLTTLFSNLLVPGLYICRTLDVRFGVLARRTLAPPMVGALCLLAAVLVSRIFIDPMPLGGDRLHRAIPLLINLTIGSTAYLVGYLAMPVGRGDFFELTRKLGLRRAAPAA
ncbi:oligosaccharide flippase family protein [Isosphaeraceae bacterium EP7]